MTRMRSLSWRVLTIVAVTALTSCVSGAVNSARPPSAESSVRLLVRNQSTEDLLVFLGRGATLIPVGRAPGLSNVSLVVRGATLGTGAGLHLHAGVRGTTPRFRSGAFDALPGATIEWDITANRSASEVIVR